MTRKSILAAAVLAAVALVVLGRLTAPPWAGRAEGLQEGQALAETAALPPAARAQARASFDDGYRAGANSVFSGYDGGWQLGRPYVVVLATGANGVTYRIAGRFRCPVATTTTYTAATPTSLLACQTDR